MMRSVWSVISYIEKIDFKTIEVIDFVLWKGAILKEGKVTNNIASALTLSLFEFPQQFGSMDVMYVLIRQDLQYMQQ